MPSTQSNTRLPLFLEPEELHDYLGVEGMLVVDVGDDAGYQLGHIPGAVLVPYPALTAGGEPAPGLLPSFERISQLMSQLGIDSNRHVVAYDHERGARACRLLWTLHVAGHLRASVLNGGFSAWVSAGFSVVTGVDAVTSASSHRVLKMGDTIADVDYVRSCLGDPNVVVLDVRSPAEYDGQDVRAARGGHIPGAVNLDWVHTLDDQRDNRLRDRDTLTEMFQSRGVTPEKEIIVYCQTHHRSAHTYAVLKHLGYPRVRAYAGSWSEWGNRTDTPVAA